MRYLFALFALVLSTAYAGPDDKMPGTDRITYFGYENCILLENAQTRVVLTESAGRILEYSHKGPNAIYLDPIQEGETFAEGQPTFGPTGGRLDIGPEMTIPAHPDLWLGQWESVITGPRSARLISKKDEPTGVQLIRDFVLDEHSTHLSVTQTIKNISDSEKHWGHWSRTFGTGGGIVLVPLTPESRFPDNYIMYGPGPVINYHPKDPNIRVRDNFLEVLTTPLRAKLGMDSQAGWFAYLDKNDLLWVKRYPVYPDRPYGELAGLTISIWYYQDQMCELEPIGPKENILPGGEASFTEDWWLLPYTYPKDGSDVDLQAIDALVEREAR
jgi:hypothetical protein